MYLRLRSRKPDAHEASYFRYIEVKSPETLTYKTCNSEDFHILIPNKLIRRVTEAFRRVFVLTGIFINGGY